MKPGHTRLVVTSSDFCSQYFVAGSLAASAQNCPSSPNYNPDFTSNQNCVVLNGIDISNPSTTYPGFYPAVPPPPSGVTTVLRLTPNQ